MNVTIMASSSQKKNSAAPKSQDEFLSLLPLDELERRVVENSIEQATKLENLKKISADNEEILNALRSDITQGQMQLEKLDEIYLGEVPQLNESLNSSVVEAHHIYAEIIQEQDNYKTKVDQVEKLLEQLRSVSLSDEMSKSKAADEAFWVEIMRAEEEAQRVFQDMGTLKDDEVQSNEFRKIVQSVHNEKTQLLKSLDSTMQEVSSLEKDEGDEEKINEEVEKTLNFQQLTLHRVKEAEALNAEVNQRKLDLSQKIMELESQHHCLKEELNRDTTKLKEVDEKIIKTNNYCKEIEGSVVQVEQLLEQMKSDHEIELNDLKVSVEKKEGKLEEMLLSVDVINSQYVKLKNDIDNHAEQNKNLQEEILKIKKETNELSERQLKILAAQAETVAAHRSRCAQIQAAQEGTSITYQKLDKYVKEEEEVTKKILEVNKALEQAKKELENLAVKKRRVITDIKDVTVDNERLRLHYEKVNRDISLLEISKQLGSTRLQDPVEGEILLRKLRDSMEDWGRDMETAMTYLLEETTGKEADLNEKLQRVELDTQSVNNKIIFGKEQLLEKKATLTTLNIEVEHGSKENNRLRTILKETQEKVIQAKQKTMELSFAIQTDHCLDRPVSQRQDEAMVLNNTDYDDEDLPLSMYRNKRKLSDSQMTSVISSEEAVVLSPNFTEPKKTLKPNVGKAKRLYVSAVSSTIHLDSDDEVELMKLT